jgi:hypothetical protein
MSETLLDTATWATTDAMLFVDDESPFRATVHPGNPRLLLIVGENAEGKSLFLRLLSAKSKAVAEDKVLTVSISIRERVGGGSNGMGRIAQAFMFGEEAEQSTGATSAGVVDQAFGQLDREGTKTILALDEPEMGLSDGYARAMGELIGTRAAGIPDGCLGVVVVSHNRALVRGLVHANLEATGQLPTLVHVGPNRDQELTDWLEATEHRTVDELLALRALGMDRWRTTIRLTRDAG